METITINIINPKAKKLIKDLVDLDLISIKEPSEKSNIKKFLELTINPSLEEISLEEITDEVEAVRKEMYEKTKNNH